MSQSPRSRRLAALIGAAGLISVVALGASAATATTAQPHLAHHSSVSTTSAQPASGQWVTRQGSSLYLNGTPWRFTGVNMYWLGLDENVTDAQGPTYPSHAAVDNGFASAAAMGATLVRSTTLGVSVGSPRSLEPTLNHFNNNAFAAIDYAVAEASKYHMHLMIPLTDEWHFYEGGKHTFTNWMGHTDIPGQDLVTSTRQRAKEAYFYNGRRVIAAFHRYVAHLINHVNPLTGLRLGSDPTIAIWETGNELWDATPSWTEQTAAYIKSLAPQALVADGSDSTGMNITQTGVYEPDVDIIDAHFYPTDTAEAIQDADYTAAQGKVYMVGEYPLDGSNVDSWLSALAADKSVAGGLAWSLFPWINGNPEQHSDGYTFHSPGADQAETDEDQAQLAYVQDVAAAG